MGVSKECFRILNTFIKPDSELHKHSYGVMKRVEEVCSKMGYTADEKLCNTALLHDIGYTKSINVSGRPNEIGFSMLESSENVYARVIKNMGTGKYDDKASKKEQLITALLDYCEATTDHFGYRCKLSEKKEDLRKTFGVDSDEYKEFERLNNYYIGVCLGIEDTIRELKEME